MPSVYDDDGHFLGTLVQELTDGPIPNETMPYGTLGQVHPSEGVDEFQNMMWNSTPYYGLRTVWQKDHGTVEQALLRIFDGSLAWQNMKFRRKHAPVC